MQLTKYYLIILLIILCFATKTILSQIPVRTFEDEIKDKIENIAENTDQDLDYTDLIENLNFFYNNPLNLNIANTNELYKLKLLNDNQINNLIDYINKYGPLVSIYELLSIDGFNTETINKILSFVTISKVKSKQKYSFKNIFKYGKNQLFIRCKQIIEKQTGYLPIQDSVLINNLNSRYLGCPQQIYTRYGFNYLNKIRFGFTAEKDAGEVLFTNNVNDSINKILGNKLKNGFDFYSGFVYVKDIGFLKTLNIGDYHLEFGQGLTMWSSLAFGKSSDVINIKRYPYGLKSNTSTNENKFLRGIAATIAINKFELTAFYSFKKVDANILETDSISNEVLFISSFQETGYHRTVNELLDKNTVKETVFGGHLSFCNKMLKIGATAFKTMLGSELSSMIYPYNKFYFRGKENLNFGFDYNFLIKNINFFGEISRSENRGMVYLSGVLFSLNQRISLSIIFRDYQKIYQNLFSNAFSENSKNLNEKGLYLGFTALLTSKLILSAYCDQFKFPWLKYRTNAPSKGSEYLAQLDFNLSENTQMYFRFRKKNKQINNTDETNYINFIENTKKQNFRYQVNYGISPSFILKNRIEYTSYKTGNQPAYHGYLIFHDVLYRPEKYPFAISFRYSMFDTDNYDTRIYAYENDVLYAFSIPGYYYKGSKIYLMIKYNVSRFLDCWLRFAQTYFSNKNVIGTGLDEIDGNVKTEVKVQLRVKF